MPMIQRFAAKIRVFKWNVNLREKSLQSLESSFGGVFLIRLNTYIPSKRFPGLLCYFAEAAVIPHSEASLWNLHSFVTTLVLLHRALVQLPFLATSQNFDAIVREIAVDMQCKFRFSPEIMSGQGSKLVIFLDLEIIMGKEAWESTVIRSIIAAGCRYDQEFLKWITVVDLGGDQIEDVLKRHLGIIVEEPKGLDEVKAGLKIKSSGDCDDLEEKVCSICLDRLSKPMVKVIETPCSHTFHRTCMFEWLRSTNSCPVCRSPCAICV